MEALKFSGRDIRAKPRRTALDPSAHDVLTAVWAKERPAVLVVRNPEVSRLCPSDGVVDRGRKHHAMQLSRLMLGKEHIPLVRGTYSSAQQLVRGVRALLENAAERGDRNLYVIGADDDVFKALWLTAVPAPTAERTGSRPMMEGTFSAEVLDLLPRVEVPAKLEQQFVGTSRASELVRQLVVRAASTAEDVLIVGDTGTGKEVIARCIQEYSGRRPFVHVSCAEYTGDELESALFGQRAGGTKELGQGFWQLAGNGMLFLDEIAGIRLEHQAMILRVLEERRIRPLGSRASIAVPARVVAASNRDLYALMQAGQFRDDLYYRLRAFMIRVLPLRSHAEDIPVLAQHFWKKITWDPDARLPDDIVSALATYPWPGNARELRAVLCSLQALFGTDGLRVEHVRAVFRDLGQAPATGPLADGDDAERQVACLRHLRHVEEVVRACEVTLRPLVEGKRVTAATASSMHAALHYRLHELDLLCLQPLLFHSEATFGAVYGLKGRLTYFHGLLEQDPKAASSYWRKEVAGEMRAVLTMVVREQGVVVDGVG